MFFTSISTATVFAFLTKFVFYLMKPSINDNEESAEHFAFNILLYSVLTFTFPCIPEVSFYNSIPEVFTIPVKIIFLFWHVLFYFMKRSINNNERSVEIICFKHFSLSCFELSRFHAFLIFFKIPYSHLLIFCVLSHETKHK